MMLQRFIAAIEAWALLDQPPGVVYLIEHFQGIAFDKYDYEKEGDTFTLTLINGDEETELTFDIDVSPDIILAALQRHAREVS